MLEVVREETDFASAYLPDEDPRPAPKAPRRDVTPSETFVALEAVASVLTVRVILLVCVLGALALAMLVVFFPSPQALWALGIFSAMIGPLSWLSQKRVR